MIKRFSLFLLFAFSAASHAQVQKWTDANGKVHYGDRAPDGITSTELPPAPPSLSRTGKSPAKGSPEPSMRSVPVSSLTDEQFAKTAQIPATPECKALARKYTGSDKWSKGVADMFTRTCPGQRFLCVTVRSDARQDTCYALPFTGKENLLEGINRP